MAFDSRILLKNIFFEIFKERKILPNGVKLYLNQKKRITLIVRPNTLQSAKLKLEQSIMQERRLASELEKEAKSRMELQCQLQALPQSFQRMVQLPAVEKENLKSPLEVKVCKFYLQLIIIRIVSIIGFQANAFN